MKAHFELKSILQSINGEEHESYRSIEGEYLFNDYTLLIDHIDADASSVLARVRVKIPQDVAGFPADTYSSRSRDIALRDFINRKFYENSKDSDINILKPGQEILERTSAFIDNSFVEIRLSINLPIKGDQISSTEAEAIIFDELPKIIESSAIFENLDKDALYKHIETNEDADFLRAELENLRLIAFVAEGSILQREAHNDSPNPEGIPFLSPPNLKMDIELPNSGQVTGMGIPRGITYIVGNSKSGKSTLLNTISQGIYNHIPGGGREFSVSNPNSVKINLENGRSIKCVNISGFKDCNDEDLCFSTDKADSITSEAANIVEAVEIGADVLLVDQECVELYIEKARSLFTEYMVSTILTSEKLDDHYGTANFIIQMNDYKAEEMAADKKIESINDNLNSSIGHIPERIPVAESIDVSTLDLSHIEQIVSKGQIAAIADTILYSRKYMDGKKSLRQLCSLVMLDLGRSGLDILNSDLHGDYAEFRKIELAAAMNRIIGLKVESKY